MPASKAEQILDLLRALLETVPGASVERNSALPEKIPGGGLTIVRDGDPGEPEEALGGFGSTYYQQRSRSRSMWSTAMRRHGTLPSMLSSSRSEKRSKLTRSSAASPSA
jgi:hypothetical protein